MKNLFGLMALFFCIALLPKANAQYFNPEEARLDGVLSSHYKAKAKGTGVAALVVGNGQVVYRNVLTLLG
jgi:hypothetical protein